MQTSKDHLYEDSMLMPSKILNISEQNEFETFSAGGLAKSQDTGHVTLKDRAHIMSRRLNEKMKTSINFSSTQTNPEKIGSDTSTKNLFAQNIHKIKKAEKILFKEK